MRKVLKMTGIVLVGLIVLLVVALAGGFIYERLSEARDAERFTAPGDLFDVEGRQLHLWCKGNGAPTVVLEAGGASSSIQWWPEAQERLANLSSNGELLVAEKSGHAIMWDEPALVVDSVRGLIANAD